MSGRSQKSAGSHAAPQGQPRKGDRVRRKGFYKSEVEREALRQGMTVEEYGVYKGSVGSAVKPVNSARGLLAICLIASVPYGISVVSFVILWLQDGFSAAAKLIFPLLLITLLLVWGWVYFARERKAEKLRKARGITLIRPE